jgi:hypothetical protein
LHPAIAKLRLTLPPGKKNAAHQLTGDRAVGPAMIAPEFAGTIFAFVRPDSGGARTLCDLPVEQSPAGAMLGSAEEPASTAAQTYWRY